MVGGLEAVEIHRPDLESGTAHRGDNDGGAGWDRRTTRCREPALARQTDVAQVTDITDLVERDCFLPDEPAVDAECDVAALVLVERPAHVRPRQEDARERDD